MKSNQPIELDRKARLDAAIAACAQRFAETRDLLEIFKSAVSIIQDHIGCDRVGIFLYDPARHSFRGAYGTDEKGDLRDERQWHITDDPRTPIRRALAGEADEFFVEDFTGAFPDDVVMRGVKNNFFIVLKARGERLGAISVDNLISQRPIDEATREELRRFSRFMALAIENLRLVERVEQKNQALLQELERRNRILAELDRANQELKEFAYVVSHDLKAPLRGISSLAQWIAEDSYEALDQSGRENLQLLLQRTKRMHDLIEGILRYSRAGTVKPQAAWLDSRAVARTVADAIAPPDAIQLVVGAAMPTVFFDRTQLEQIFQNLMSNAVVHLGKPDGRVEVSGADRGSAWEFCVRDNGVGIEARHFERIFKVFQTLGNSSGSDSTGIGLAIVKKVVETHGGSVRVESEVGSGSAFYFTIPKPPAGTAGPEGEPRARVVPAPAG
jgi:signal transduction histidine kinase